MTLNISNTIDDNIITVDIAVASLGTTTTTETLNMIFMILTIILLNYFLK